MAGTGLRVEGLRQLSKELRTADKSLRKELTKANRDATKPVFEIAEQHAVFYGGSTAKAFENRSIAQFSQQTKAGIRMRSNSSTQFGLGGEFGAKRFRQFLPWRGAGQEAGYTVWPAIRDLGPKLLRPYEQALARIIRKAFPD